MSLYDLLILCETKSLEKKSHETDLIYSDTSHGETTAAQQQVVFINHGDGAVSQIRRTSYIQPKPPPLPLVHFRPHINHYPNSIYENSFADEPYINFPEDIPRVFERRIGETTPNPIESQPTPPPPPLPVPQPFRAPEIRAQPLQEPPPLPVLQPFRTQPLQESPPLPVPQPFRAQPPQEPPPPKIDDENEIIHRDIERIQRIPHPTQPPYPIYPPRPKLQNDSPINSFFNFAQPPELFSNFDSPFDPFTPQIPPLFQRRRLTINNNNNNNNNNNLHDFDHNSIGYPSYTYYKGGGDENPSLTNWPKIFKFTDGRASLYEFEKQKKLSKIKFNSKETYFDNISRDSFLILHGGAYTQ